MLLLFGNSFAQSFLNGDFSSGSTSWKGNPEVNVETPYGGLDASNKVAEIDSIKFIRQKIGGFTTGYTYTLSYLASRRETSDCHGGTPSTVDFIIYINAVPYDTVERSNTTFALTAGSLSFTTGSGVDSVNFKFDHGPNSATSTCGILVDNIVLNSVLPINLLYFNTKYEGDANQIIIDWETLNEEECCFFELEHSTDGIDWIAIAKIACEGNLQSNKKYRYIDNHPTIGLNYYRLIQSDDYGKKSYSKTEVCNALCRNTINLFPNPSSSHILNLDDLCISVLDIKVFNAVGQSLDCFLFSPTKVLDLTSLNAGVYQVVITTKECGVYFNRLILN